MAPAMVAAAAAAAAVGSRHALGDDPFQELFLAMALSKDTEPLHVRAAVKAMRQFIVTDYRDDVYFCCIRERDALDGRC